MSEQAANFGSSLEINENFLLENLAVFKSKLKPETKIMAMVKAVAYGHGAVAIAKKLQDFNAVHYLGVANLTKGIELREAGIHLPIMVTNPISSEFKPLIAHSLEPVLHNLELAKSFSDFLQNNNESSYPAHLKFNTGMNRFGMDLEEVDECLNLAKDAHWSVRSVMTHLACTDVAEEDDFTKDQLKKFELIKAKFVSGYQGNPFYHVLNTNGVLRFPEAQHDLVRIGIGLYGATEFKNLQSELKPIAVFKTKIAQVRKVKKGASISYSRSGRASRDTYIGTLSVGYADGFPRCMGNGNWEIELSGKLYPTIGNICMDYCMIDLGPEEPEIQLEQEVIIFGGIKSVYEYAESMGTISYEAMTNIGNRVQRIIHTHQ